MELSVVVVVVGCVVGRQWQVHWEASGQVSSVNPTTNLPPDLSQPLAHLPHMGTFSMGPRKPLPTPPWSITTRPI